MNVIDGLIVGVLCLAALVASWRVLRGGGAWPWIRVLGHGLMASLLYVLIFPPAIDHSRLTGIILTPGATPQQVSERERSLPSLALPGVESSDPSIIHVPDLATGLRQHPEIGDLRVLGDGLPARDREAIEDRGLVFEPGGDLNGIVELWQPAFVREGALWELRGRAAGGGIIRVELRDRSDRVVATETTDADGSFKLSIRAKAPGESLYRLQLLDDSETRLEEIPVPMVVVDGDGVRTLILSGGPDADLKYLRRWIIDSGNSVASRISLSPGIEQNQNETPLSAPSLAETDLLIVDQRAWADLSSSAKALIRSALEQGMGVLFRVTGALSAAVSADWKTYGFEIRSADVSRSVNLAKPLAEMTLARAQVEIVAKDAVAYASGSDGSLLVGWRAIAQGRVAAWLPLDSYRLQLSGDSSGYGSLWSGIFTQVSRARGSAFPILPVRPRVAERSVFCDLDTSPRIEDPDSSRHDLLIEPEANSCAAWWPEQSGWHRLTQGDSSWPIYVPAADDAKSLARVKVRQATSRLQRNASGQAIYRAAMARWPLFLVWLLICSFFWWLERRLSR